MTNVPVQIQLPQRRRNIAQKLGRLYAFGFDEVSRFTDELNKDLNLSRTYSYPKILEIINTSSEYTDEAENIINKIEMGLGITSGDNLLEDSLKHENKLAWVIEYSDEQLVNWVDDKIVEIAKICGNNKSFVDGRIKVMMKEESSLKNIKILDYTPKLNIDRLNDYKYKRTLISVLIKLTVGYLIRCTGILA